MTATTRTRTVLALTLATTLGAASPGSTGDGADDARTRAPNATAPQGQDLHLIPGTFSPVIGPDGNTVVLHGPEGLVVIDAGRHLTHSRKILDYAESTGKPIVAILNTHWHLDHSTGNQDLKAAYPGAVLYTTRAVEGALAGFLAAGAARTEEALKNPDLPEADRARMERGFRTIRDRVALLPDVPVDATTSLRLAGRALELNVTGRAVTESDVWVWDPSTSTVIAGDLVTLPVPLFDTGCPIGWLEALDAIAAKSFAQLIPGHGFPMDGVEFQTYRTAFANLVACAGEQDGQACAERWMSDADALLSKAAGEDYADPDYARAAAAYYVDRILRDAAKRTEFCGA